MIELPKTADSFCLEWFKAEVFLSLSDKNLISLKQKNWPTENTIKKVCKIMLWKNSY